MNEKEVLQNYLKILKLSYEEDKLSKLLNIDKEIKRLSMFSPNEEFEEIIPEYWILLNIPYEIG